MIQLIRYIDEIAVRDQTNVMYITFARSQFNGEPERWEVRSNIMQWCENESIPLYKCSGISLQEGINSYQGQLHVDIPYDLQDERFKTVDRYLENSDGSPRFAGVTFKLLTLDDAKQSYAQYQQQEEY